MKYIRNKEYLDDYRILKYIVSKKYNKNRTLILIGLSIIVIGISVYVPYSIATQSVDKISDFEHPQGMISEYVEESDFEWLPIGDSVFLSLESYDTMNTNYLKYDELDKMFKMKLENLSTNPKLKGKVDVRFIADKLKTYDKFISNGNNAVKMQSETVKRLIVDAMVEQELYGIPASIKMAQIIIESQSMKSKLAVGSNNLFGIKWKKDSQYGKDLYETLEYHPIKFKNGVEISPKLNYPVVISKEKVRVNGKFYWKCKVKDYFKKYNSYWESIRDHSIFLKGERYKSLYESTDYKDWAYGLQKCGYATSKKYTELLIKVIEAHNLNHFDK